MKYLSAHFKEIERKCSYPEEAVKTLEELAEKIDNNSSFASEFEKIRLSYMNSKSEKRSNDRCMKALEMLAEKQGVNPYTLHLVFLMVCAELLHKRYISSGLDEKLFWDGVFDLKYKMLECMDCEHCVGTFVAGWNWGFYHLTRFALGRFQYEYTNAENDFETKSGYKIKKGQPTINFHIPSSGVPLSDDVRFDSYKRAYDFFKDRLTPEGYLILECHSWLLFPKHSEFLDKNSNILRFDSDFEIYRSEERDNFHDDWRVWGAYTELPLEEWPADTKLRKAYKEWMLAGKRTGYGCGYIIFDGNKIVR